MSPWIRRAAWAAAIALPGGLLLLPVIVADHLERRRQRGTTHPAR
ncbi:MAG: hypothetical protein OEY14_03375 [Myxococcales bacterium]|nr:hypothetical protein [Myxococcales bacterium]